MKCPYCGYKYDCHKTVSGREDFKDDDISFCINCGRVGLFKGNTVVAFDEKRLPPDAQAEIARLRHHWHDLPDNKVEK